MSEQNSSKYFYKYSALGENARREVESIRQEYSAKSVSETKYEQLIKLDKKISSVPKIVSLSVGIIGALVFGMGLSMVLKFDMFFSGIAISVIGTIIMISAAEIRNVVHTLFIQKYRAKILMLAQQLLENK